MLKHVLVFVLVSALVSAGKKGGGGGGARVKAKAKEAAVDAAVDQARDRVQDIDTEQAVDRAKNADRSRFQDLFGSKNVKPKKLNEMGIFLPTASTVKAVPKACLDAELGESPGMSRIKQGAKGKFYICAFVNFQHRVGEGKISEPYTQDTVDMRFELFKNCVDEVNRLNSECESATFGTVSETVPGEITPVSAEQCRTYENYEARFAIDRDWSTRSDIVPCDDGIAWIKVKLGQVYCIDRVIRYIDSPQSYDSYSCSQDECTAEQETWGEFISVYTESTTTANLPSTTDCKLGDTVKLYRDGGRDILYLNELVITAKLEKWYCGTLETTWDNVVTDPQLPTEHGTAITLGCTAGHTNTRGNKASCQNGKIVPTDEPPRCQIDTSMNRINFFCDLTEEEKAPFFGGLVFPE